MRRQISCGHPVPKKSWPGPDGVRVFCEGCQQVRSVLIGPDTKTLVKNRVIRGGIRWLERRQSSEETRKQRS